MDLSRGLGDVYKRQDLIVNDVDAFKAISETIVFFNYKIQLIM
jgi:hypothetical protein